MKLIVGDRQTGRTTALLEWLVAAPDDEARVIVGPFAQWVDRLKGMCRQEGLVVEGWQIVSARTVQRSVLHGRGRFTKFPEEAVANRRVVFAIDDFDPLNPDHELLSILRVVGDVEVLVLTANDILVLDNVQLSGTPWAETRYAQEGLRHLVELRALDEHAEPQVIYETGRKYVVPLGGGGPQTHAELSDFPVVAP